MTASTASATILTIPAHTIVARRETIPTYADEAALFEEFEAQLHEVLASTGTALSGEPCGATFYEDGYVERDVDIEVWEVVASPVRPVNAQVPVPPEEEMEEREFHPIDLEAVLRRRRAAGE